jgi:hypothetical protein
VVTQNGEPVEPGFVLYEVAPERWYAVQDDGEVYSQDEFEKLHALAYVEWFRSRGEKIHKPRFVSGEIKPQWTADGSAATPEALSAKTPEGYEVKAPTEAQEVSAAQNAADARIAALEEKLEKALEGNANLQKLVDLERGRSNKVDAPIGKLELKKQKGAREVEMPCGRTIDRRGAKTHARHCDECMGVLEKAFGPDEG